MFRISFRDDARTARRSALTALRGQLARVHVAEDSELHPGEVLDVTLRGTTSESTDWLLIRLHNRETGLNTTGTMRVRPEHIHVG